jgi:signal transduction histidine kinase
MLKTPNQTLDTALPFAQFVKYASLLIALAAFITIPVYTFIFSAPNFAWVKWAMAAAAIISIGAAVLAHRGQPALGAIALSVTITYTTLASVQPDDFLSRPNGATLVIPVTIMGFVFGMRVALALAGAVIVAMLLVPVFIPGAAWSPYTTSNVSLHCMSVGLLWLIHHLFAQLRLANLQLRETNEREQETRNLMRYFQHELRGYVVGLKGVQTIIRGLLTGKTNGVTDPNATLTFLERTVEDIDNLLQKLMIIGRHGALPGEEPEAINIRSLLEHERERLLATTRYPNLTVTVEAPAELTIAASRLYLVLAIRTALRNTMEAFARLPSAFLKDIHLVAAEERNRVVLVVRDNGPGFPAGLADNEGVPGWSTKDDGSGLGLALIRHVAALHGGSMRFGNAPNRAGAWIKIELALQPAPAIAVNSTS